MLCAVAVCFAPVDIRLKPVKRDISVLRESTKQAEATVPRFTQYGDVTLDRLGNIVKLGRADGVHGHGHGKHWPDHHPHHEPVHWDSKPKPAARPHAPASFTKKNNAPATATQGKINEYEVVFLLDRL